MDRIILHIDVNNAFLSWSAVDLLRRGSKDDIREKCAVIGGDESKRHGVVLARSNSAKKLGIVTGVSLYEAKKICPSIEIYSPQYDVYQKMSNDLFDLLRNYSPDIEVYSIDECFFDYGKVKNLYGDEILFANRIREEIKRTLGFTVNIGIGNNKLCAKMASNFLKPDLVHTLYEHEVKNKMWPLPVGELFGIGMKTNEKLAKLNIITIKDLANYDSNELYKYFKNMTKGMIEKANGKDNSQVVSEASLSKGISNSITVSKDLREKSEIYNVLRGISENLATVLRREKRYAQVVAIILKDNQFITYCHQQKLNNSTNITSEIFEASKRLLDELWKGKPIRLVGIRLDQLVNKSSYQVSIFEENNSRERITNLEKTIDQLNEKYGSVVVTKAVFKKKNDY